MHAVTTEAMDVEHVAQPSSSSRPDSGSRTRKASPLPRTPAALPKAPMSKEVAQRLLRNGSAPIKRFDSADYFLQLHNERTKASSGDGASGTAAQPGKMHAEMSIAHKWPAMRRRIMQSL